MIAFCLYFIPLKKKGLTLPIRITLSGTELREKDLHGGLAIGICKLLKCNLALKRSISICSGFHLQSCPGRDSVALPAKPQWTRDWDHFTSPHHSKLTTGWALFLCPNWLLFFPLVQMFHLCSFHWTHGFHLPCKYWGFLLLGSTRICK